MILSLPTLPLLILMENCVVVLIIYWGESASHRVWKQTPSFTSHSQPFSSKRPKADDENALLLICPLPPSSRFASGATHPPCCKSSIRTFSRHPNCRNCGWRLSIDHRVTPGPGALSRLYPAPARGNHTTGDRSAHATSLSFPSLQLQTPLSIHSKQLSRLSIHSGL